MAFLLGICTLGSGGQRGGGIQSDQCPCLRTYRPFYCRAKQCNNQVNNTEPFKEGDKEMYTRVVFFFGDFFIFAF